jgi:FMN phosphatase YigB (HAD superfamily)
LTDLNLSNIEAIFLDDGGVINDNSKRTPQWQRLIGEFMVTRFGGDADAWVKSNVAFIAREAKLMHDGDFFPPGVDPDEVIRQRDDRFITEMCKDVGIEPPGSSEERVVLARELHNYGIANVRAEFPGAVDAIRELHSMGYAIYMASGGSSVDLRLQLTASDVADLFTETYGSDIAGIPKGGREFYDSILEHSGVEAAVALFLDDTPNSIRRIAEVGARCVLISTTEEEPAAIARLGSLVELPGLLRGLMRSGLHPERQSPQRELGNAPKYLLIRI